MLLLPGDEDKSLGSTNRRAVELQVVTRRPAEKKCLQGLYSVLCVRWPQSG